MHENTHMNVHTSVLGIWGYKVTSQEISSRVYGNCNNDNVTVAKAVNRYLVCPLKITLLWTECLCLPHLYVVIRGSVWWLLEEEPFEMQSGWKGRMNVSFSWVELLFYSGKTPETSHTTLRTYLDTPPINQKWSFLRHHIYCHLDCRLPLSTTGVLTFSSVWFYHSSSCGLRIILTSKF